MQMNRIAKLSYDQILVSFNPISALKRLDHPNIHLTRLVCKSNTEEIYQKYYLQEKNQFCRYGQFIEKMTN